MASYNGRDRREILEPRSLIADIADNRNVRVPLSTPMSNLARLWIGWVLLTSSVAAWACLWVPSFLASPAYSYVIDLAGGFYFVGAYFTVVIVLLLTGVMIRSPRILSLGLGIHALIHLSFGFSIFVLTLQGSIAAITGALQWWTSSVISTFFIWTQSRFNKPPA